MMGPARWSEKYLEIPFVDPGFSMSGCHCWGLIWLVYRSECNIELNKYAEFSASQLRQAAKLIGHNRFLPPWTSVVGPRKPFDVVVMKCDNENPGLSPQERRIEIPGHVGIATSANHILHIEEGIHSVNMIDTHPRIAQRIIGAYRHEALL